MGNLFSNSCRLSLVLIILLLVNHCFPQKLFSQQLNQIVSADSILSSTLTLDCEYQGLTVSIDKDSVGVTPLENYAILPGEYLIQVQYPFSNRWYQEPWSKTIHVLANQSYHFTVRFLRLYLIDSIPYGADVFVNGKKIGNTPTTVIAGPDSIVAATVSKEHFEPVSLTLGDQNEGKIVLSLEHTKNWLLQNNSLIMKKKEKTDEKRISLYASIASTVIAGIGTIYFRNQANDFYDSYLHTGLPSDMAHYYDKTRDYDRLAGYSYAIFQISFLLSSYFFISSTWD